MLASKLTHTYMNFDFEFIYNFARERRNPG